MFKKSMIFSPIPGHKHTTKNYHLTLLKKTKDQPFCLRLLFSYKFLQVSFSFSSSSTTSLPLQLKQQFLFLRSTMPSSSRHYSRVVFSLSPWALTLASSPTLAASSCLPLTLQCLPMSSSTHLPAWPCSPPPSHLLRSQWRACPSRILQVHLLENL